MWLDVVSDHSSHRLTLLQASLAEGVLAHLVFLLGLPATQTIPVAGIAFLIRGHGFACEGVARTTLLHWGQRNNSKRVVKKAKQRSRF